MSDTQGPIDNKRGFRDRGLRSHSERTSLQEGGLYKKKRKASMSVQQLPPTALLTLRVNVPLFCQCVSLHTY